MSTQLSGEIVWDGEERQRYVVDPSINTGPELATSQFEYVPLGYQEVLCMTDIPGFEGLYPNDAVRKDLLRIFGGKRWESPTSVLHDQNSLTNLTTDEILASHGSIDDLQEMIRATEGVNVESGSLIYTYSVRDDSNNPVLELPLVLSQDGIPLMPTLQRSASKLMLLRDPATRDIAQKYFRGIQASTSILDTYLNEAAGIYRRSQIVMPGVSNHLKSLFYERYSTGEHVNPNRKRRFVPDTIGGPQPTRLNYSY